MLEGPHQEAPVLNEIVEAMARRVWELCGEPDRGALDWDRFVALAERIAAFDTPSTTFTPAMSGLVWALGRQAAPTYAVGVGTYVGHTFAWLTGLAGDNEADARFTAVDIDSDATARARLNLGTLGFGDRLEAVCADGCAFLSAGGPAIDCLYLDIDDPETGKAGYLDLLRASLPRLAPGALILAHDVLVPRFEADFVSFLGYIGNSKHLKGPWTLDVDACGLVAAATL